MLKRVSPDQSRAEHHGSPADFIDRARQLAPLIAGASQIIEQERAIPETVLFALHEARLFRMLLPRSCDGEEIEPAVFLQVIEQIAKADASTAWCIGQASGGSLAAAYLKLEVARNVFRDPRASMASGPTFGTALAVGGGYRVSGEWAFASGIKHATWLAGHCLVREADGTQRVSTEGTPVERTMIFPKSSAATTDIWHVVGLKGTASDKYSVNDLFVPADYSFTRESAADRRETGPLYRFTIYHIFGIAFAGVALGIARATLDAFIELAKDKIPRAATRVLRDSAMIQFQIGLSEARLQSARTFLLQTLRDLWDSASRENLTLDQRVTLRMASTYATHQARDVVDAAYHASGATAIFEANPFERRFRDVHTVSQQVQGHSSNFEVVGQALLGMQPKSKLL